MNQDRGTNKIYVPVGWNDYARHGKARKLRRESSFLERNKVLQQYLAKISCLLWIPPVSLLALWVVYLCLSLTQLAPGSRDLCQAKKRIIVM